VQSDGGNQERPLPKKYACCVGGDSGVGAAE